MRPFHVRSRRQFLKGLGLGALASLSGADALRAIAAADDLEAAPRLVLWTLEHAPVWDRFHLRFSEPRERTVERDLRGLARDELTDHLRPFYGIRDRVLALEGLANTSALGDFLLFAGNPAADFNNHTLAWAHLLTARPGLHRQGTAVVGGGRSIDQELGRRLASQGKPGARVWGGSNASFSYAEAGALSGSTDDPMQIYADLLGVAMPSPGPSGSREERIRLEHASALDTAAREYAFVLPRVGAQARMRLEAHRDLLRDLERSLGIGVPTSCAPSAPTAAAVVDQYVELAALSLSCDVARVLTIIPPMVQPASYGYPADINVHTHHAHSSVDDGGEPFSRASEDGMVAYTNWYAERVVRLAERLDAIPSSSGSLLHSTCIAWLPELGSPTHQHHDVATVLIGGEHFFRTGRYVRFGRSVANPFPPELYDNFPFPASHRTPWIGPSRNQLFVTFLRSFGFDDATFGLDRLVRTDGSVLDLRGTLGELHG